MQYHIKLDARALGSGGRLPPCRLHARRHSASSSRRSTSCSSNSTNVPAGGEVDTKASTLGPGDLVSQVATILSEPKYIEAMTAINVELLKAAMVGSAAADAEEDSEGGDTGSDPNAPSPEKMFEDIYDAVLAKQRDSAHLIGEAERTAWEEAGWEVYHATRVSLQRLLFGLLTAAADMGSSTAALQAADALTKGVLIPRDQAAAFKWYTRASGMGSAAASLKLGITYFHGTPPAGQDPSRAYECFTSALSQAEEALQAHQARMQARAEGFASLSPAEQDAAVGTDLAYLEAMQEQRSSALTWLGRCYLEGVGVPRDVPKSAQLFREAGNEEELRELAMLKKQFEAADLDLPDVP